METLPAGTSNVQGIIDSNFAILDDYVASHAVLSPSTSFAIDAHTARTQEMDISANNTIITGITNEHPGHNILLILHFNTGPRTVIVPGTWEPVGTPVLTVNAAGAIAIRILPGVNVTAYATL